LFYLLIKRFRIAIDKWIWTILAFAAPIKHAGEI